MKSIGMFYGIGVGPGEPGLIPLIAWQALKKCKVIFVPRSKKSSSSIARHCLAGLNLPSRRFREIEFQMDSDHAVLQKHYHQLAKTIAAELRAGKNTAYITLGDPFTYSTYSYTLSALRKCLPKLRYRTFPGITSYSSVAAATNWPLGEGKERILILPCPDRVSELREVIKKHDTVVLMKIGKRLPQVLKLLKEMKIDGNCALGSRVGLVGEFICKDVKGISFNDSLGYLSTMLIRKKS